MGKWLTDYDELRHTDWCFVVFETAQQLDEPERTLALAVFENEDAYRVAKAADFDDSSQMLLLQYIDEHAAQGSDKVFFKLRDGTTCYIAARNAREIDLELQVRPSINFCPTMLCLTGKKSSFLARMFAQVGSYLLLPTLNAACSEAVSCFSVARQHASYAASCHTSFRI